LGAFSLRPIIVRTMPVYNSAGLNMQLPGMTNAMPNSMPNSGVSMVTNMVNVNTAQITTLSMVPLRIPFVESGGNNKFGIQSAVQQTQLYIQNKQISVKKQEILLAREFVTFYVNRRSKTFDFMKYLTPFSMSSLPISSTGLEEAIDATICFGQKSKSGDNDFDDDIYEEQMSIRLGDQARRFALLSAVTVKTLKSRIQSSGVGPEATAERNLIVGSKAYVRIYGDTSGGNISCDKLINTPYHELSPEMNDRFMCYDPLKLGTGCTDKGFIGDNSYQGSSGADDDKGKLEGVFADTENSKARGDIKRCGTLLIFVRCSDGKTMMRDDKMKADESKSDPSDPSGSAPVVPPPGAFGLSPDSLKAARAALKSTKAAMSAGPMAPPVKDSYIDVLKKAKLGLKSTAPITATTGGGNQSAEAEAEELISEIDAMLEELEN